MLYVYLVVLLYALFRAIRGVVRTKSSLKWIAHNSRSLESKVAAKSKIRIYILIPVLREQEVIKATFNNFAKLNGNYKVIFITTNKEDREKAISFKALKNIKGKLLSTRSRHGFANASHGIFPRSLALSLYGKKWSEIISAFKELPNTKTLLKSLVATSSEKVKSRVSIYNYPKTTGNMSDQLNFALRKLSKTEDLQNTYVCMYNADSIVSKDFPLYIKNFVNKNTKAEVIQQSALFLSNFTELGNTISGSLLRAVALLQSRWTLAHEMPRIFNQLNSTSECAHIVGHGLIIKLGVMEKTGYFPNNYVNEDLPFGYILKLSGYDIYSFPQLENAQSPTSIKSMFTQYTTWFYGAFHYPKYMINAFRECPGKKIQAFVWAAKYSIRSILWLGLSIIWLFLLTYPLFTGNLILFLVSVLIFIIYAPFCFRVMEKELNKNGKKIFGENVFRKIIITPETYFMSIPAYLTHSFGPIKASIETLKSLLFRSEIKKMKTER